MVGDLGDKMKCVDGCEFQSFNGKIFKCTIYENKLSCYKENGNVEVIRCNQCIEDAIEYTLTRRKNELDRMAQDEENGK